MCLPFQVQDVTLGEMQCTSSVCDCEEQGGNIKH